VGIGKPNLFKKAKKGLEKERRKGGKNRQKSCTTIPPMAKRKKNALAPFLFYQKVGRETS